MGTPDTKNDSLSTDANSSQDVVIKPKEVNYEELFKKEEKRAKDNQAAFTKSRQELSVLKKENSVLETKLRGNIILPVEQQKELDDLKFEDPDAWYTKKNSYETEAMNVFNQTKSKARDEALLEVVQQTQDEQIATWLEANPGLTVENLQLDVPPRIHSAFKAGTLDFAEYLEKSKLYLTTTKKELINPSVNDIKDLNKVPGSTKPTTEAVIKQSEVDAKIEIY